MFSAQTLMILVFLVPGFLSMAFLDMLVPARKRDDLQKVASALIFSLIIYFVHSLIFARSPMGVIEKTIGEAKSYEVSIPALSIAVVSGLALFLPVLLALLQKYDLHMKFFRRLKVTDRTSRSNVWFDVFTDIKSHIILNFEDGRRLFGWPQYYSDDPEDKTLFLCHAAWVQENGDLTWLNLKGILITPNQKIETIEFCKLEGECNEQKR
jgi:hypothetical protein